MYAYGPWTDRSAPRFPAVPTWWKSVLPTSDSKIAGPGLAAFNNHTLPEAISTWTAPMLSPLSRSGTDTCRQLWPPFMVTSSASRLKA